MRDNDLLRDVADAIADGQPVDWTTVGAAARTDRQQALLAALRIVSHIASADPLDPQPNAPPCRRGQWILFWIVLPVAALKVLLGAVGWVVSLTAPTAEPLPPWPYISNVVVFGIVGAFLVRSRADLRARHLGALFLLIAVAFSDRLLLGLSLYDETYALVTVLRAVSLDAFIAFALWSFVWSFPAPPLRGHDRRVTSILLWISFVVALVLVTAGMAWSVDLASVGLSKTAAVVAVLARQASVQESYYSLLVYGLALPTLPYLLWKSRFEAAEKRRRAALFTTALVAGLAPMLLVVIVSAFADVLQKPSRWPVFGAVVYLSLLSVAPLTAYAILVHRVIDVPSLVTKAMQPTLVRAALWVMSLTPFVCLFVYVYLHRNVTVAEMVANGRFTLLVPMPLVTMLVLTYRKQLLSAIDRWLLGAPPDSTTILGRLQRDLRGTLGVQDVAAVVTREVERAVHPQIAAVSLVDETARRLISSTGLIRPLDVQSVLGKLLHVAREEIFAGVDASGPVAHLLPDEERRWLIEHGVQLLIPLIGSRGGLLGIVVIGQKRSGAPFSNEDRVLLGTMASHAAVVLENRALGNLRSQAAGLAGQERAQTIDWGDEPGALCRSCRRVWPARQTLCECGAHTASTAVPLLIGGKFRVERLLGSGGMSLVYLAIDLTLNRRVAIKTLPHLTEDHIRRLRREARVMAAVSAHPNLATIFGTEEWRGVPLIIVEYLEGGTLADRLGHERLSIDDVVELGTVLADALDAIHRAGILHRDIKPSNIGYTREGVPKLLDFGVATMLPLPLVRTSPADHGLEPSGDMAHARDSIDTATWLTHADYVAGTPPYLSPEALAGAKPDVSFDVWSLTVVLFEALTGQHPFNAPTRAETFNNIRLVRMPAIRDVYDACPDSLTLFFHSALDRDPARRPSSASELRARLQSVHATLRTQLTRARAS